MFGLLVACGDDARTAGATGDASSGTAASTSTTSSTTTGSADSGTSGTTIASSGSEGPGSSSGSGDGSSGSGTDTTGGQVTWPQPCGDLYAQDLLPTFELTITPQELQGMQSDCQDGIQSYRPIEFTYGGETVAAMARLKGNWTWSCDKYQFVISFNEVDPDARFHGLRKIVLDAPWYDHSMMHERLAFPLFESLGLPYSCVNNARVVINGEYYGLYANLERLDREYLERNFEEPDGNLYKGGAELVTNEDMPDTTRLDALYAASSVDELAMLIDLDQAVAEWAAEAMLPAMDNYWAGVEINYYLYDHPSRGFVYLPYDLDISFGDAAYGDGSLLWPDSATADPITHEHGGWGKEAIVMMVLADPVWCDRFVEALTAARMAYSPDAMSASIDAWEAQIADALADDPNRPYSVADHETALERLHAFLPERAAFVDDWLAEGGHCPAQW
ncbi:MAG: CotH kinase family protein [Nannocystaceae bacterium]|nr:CotH kinase family protein [Nannocystaceae bacterium]